MNGKTWDAIGTMCRDTSDRRVDPCFIHVRRQDYTIASTIAYHGLMGMEYYSKAIEYIKERKRVQFYVFSDDIEWCRQNFIGDEFTFVDFNRCGNGDKGPGQESNDLFLMQLCQHAIIPNSSFGWWGAWLGKYKLNRIVIAPKDWFTPGGTAKHLDTKDICPADWIRL